MSTKSGQYPAVGFAAVAAELWDVRQRWVAEVRIASAVEEPHLDYTREQLDQFRVEIRSRRQAAGLAIFLIALPLYGLMFSLIRGQVFGLSLYAWIAIWVVVLVLSGAFVFTRLRCPACVTNITMKLTPSCPKNRCPLK